MIAYIALGSNLNNPAKQVQNAVRLIRDIPDTAVIAESSLYHSKPQGPPDQPDYVNQVIAVETALTAHALLYALQDIEKTMGRVRTVRWGPRIIDIDILLMKEVIYKSELLTVPHPQMHKRRFTLVPLAQIAPDALHPVFQVTIKDLLSICKDTLEVNLFPSSPAPRPTHLSP